MWTTPLLAPVLLLLSAPTALRCFPRPWRHSSGGAWRARCLKASAPWRRRPGSLLSCKNLGVLPMRLLGRRSCLGTIGTCLLLIPSWACFGTLGFFEEECSATQFEAFTQVVMHGTDLMQLPRSHGKTPMAAEIVCADRLSSTFVADAASGVPYLQTRGLAAPLVQLLTAAWERLQRSGVLQARGLLTERRRREMSAVREKAVAGIRTAMAAPGLRSCALASCGAKEAHPQHFKSCAACRTVVYCCREHQLEDWPAHKAACKAARKAAAAASDGGGAGPGAAS